MLSELILPDYKAIPTKILVSSNLDLRIFASMPVISKDFNNLVSSRENKIRTHCANFVFQPQDGLMRIVCEFWKELCKIVLKFAWTASRWNKTNGFPKSEHALSATELRIFSDAFQATKLNVKIFSTILANKISAKSFSSTNGFRTANTLAGTENPVVQTLFSLFVGCVKFFSALWTNRICSKSKSFFSCWHNNSPSEDIVRSSMKVEAETNTNVPLFLARLYHTCRNNCWRFTWDLIGGISVWEPNSFELHFVGVSLAKPGGVISPPAHS